MIIIVNFGGQYAHLIARRVRDLGVKSELVAPDISMPEVKKLNPQAIIFSGSPYSCYEKDAPRVDKKIYSLGIPILGICYGQQLMALNLGGKVSSHTQKQFGKEILKLGKSPLFSKLKKSEIVWFSHGDQVDKTPSGFTAIASTKNAKVAAMQNLSKNFYSVQFHPEVTHTPNGRKILENFLFKIAKAKKDWNIENLKAQIVNSLRQKIGSNTAIMAISGGVDSLVAAVILKSAIGSQLKLIFIDTGFLRQYDLEDLEKVLNKTKLKNVKIVDAQKRFLTALEGIVEPEEKRHVIAKHYFEIFKEEAAKIKGAKFLGQGTIYPDRIESAMHGKLADKIKSHHNLSVPKDLGLEIIEPLGDFYKDEVRKLGKILGIDGSFLNRHPFPGPGLAIRVLGEVTQERLDIVKKADAIFVEELKSSGIYSRAGQALAALLPVKAVGVMGDARTYSYIIALRCVDTADFMTADWTKIPSEVLEKTSTRIVNEVRGVNRVLYDITQKPPATIEYE